MMLKLKTLVRDNRLRIINALLSAVWYAIACLLLNGIPYLAAIALWTGLQTVYYIFVVPDAHYRPFKDQVGKTAAVIFLIIANVIRFALVSLAWNYIRWLTVPIFAAGNEVFLYSDGFDYEPNGGSRNRKGDPD